MSAIWGVIDLENKDLGKNIYEKMELPYKKYPIDEFSHIEDKNIMIGCGKQFVTKESMVEINPYWDKERDIFFTGDIYLYNRNEFVNEDDSATDSEIIYDQYIKYGTESFKNLSGVFAFVIYERQKNKVLIVSDKTSSRMLYYKFEKGKIIFSTLIESIKSISPHNEINKRWLGDYFALDGFPILTEDKETPYKNILKISSGNYIEIIGNEISEKEYYNPVEEIKKQKRKKDEDYKKEFNDIYRKSVKDSLRCKDKIGMLLSGGLDSTSVACLAADILKEEGKNLYSYTSVPLEDYISTMKKNMIVNEKEYVEETINKYKNIVPKYIDCKGETGLSEMDELLSIYEIPYKNIQNSVWLKNSFKEARKDGCRIMLNGQYGNSTVSFGSIYIELYTLLKKGRLIKFIKEINHIHKIYNMSRKKLLLQNIMGLKKIEAKYDKHEMFKNVYVNNRIIDEFKIGERFYEKNYNMPYHNMMEYDEYAPYKYYKIFMSPIGEFETKLSLYTGVLILDPTRNDKIIEFCLNIPHDQYVKKGVERRLIRDYMRGIVPDKHLDNIKKSGYQGADLCYRLEKDWDKINKSIRDIVEDPRIGEMVDIEKLKKDFDLLEEKIKASDMEFVFGFMYTISGLKYFLSIMLENL